MLFSKVAPASKLYPNRVKSHYQGTKAWFRRMLRRHYSYLNGALPLPLGTTPLFSYPLADVSGASRLTSTLITTYHNKKAPSRLRSTAAGGLALTGPFCCDTSKSSPRTTNVSNGTVPIDTFPLIRIRGRGGSGGSRRSLCRGCGRAQCRSVRSSMRCPWSRSCRRRRPSRTHRRVRSSRSSRAP